MNQTARERAGAGADAGALRTAAERRPQRLDLDGVEGAIGLGRDFARRLLEAWDWPEQRLGPVVAAEDVVLVVSELVTNAAVHGRGARHLAFDALPGLLRIEVRDRDASAPRPRDGVPGIPGGYGLHIVDRLAAEWGHAFHPETGKTVWVLIPAPWRTV